MKILIDTNVILDVLLDRAEFFRESDAIWKACTAGTVSGYISSLSLVNIFYVGRKFVGKEKALQGVHLCVGTLHVCGVFLRQFELHCAFVDWILKITSRSNALLSRRLMASSRATNRISLLLQFRFTPRGNCSTFFRYNLPS